MPIMCRVVVTMLVFAAGRLPINSLTYLRCETFVELFPQSFCTCIRLFFRLLAVEDKLRQCAVMLLESLSCLTLDEQKDLCRFLVPEVRQGIMQDISN